MWEWPRLLGQRRGRGVARFREPARNAPRCRCVLKPRDQSSIKKLRGYDGMHEIRTLLSERMLEVRAARSAHARRRRYRATASNPNRPHQRCRGLINCGSISRSWIVRRTGVRGGRLDYVSPPIAASRRVCRRGHRRSTLVYHVWRKQTGAAFPPFGSPTRPVMRNETHQ
jgi:hypothetical protein